MDSNTKEDSIGSQTTEIRIIQEVDIKINDQIVYTTHQVTDLHNDNQSFMHGKYDCHLYFLNKILHMSIFLLSLEF